MSTVKQEYSRRISAPPDESVRIDNGITIERPVSEVYSFWRRLENLPRFMRHLESVTVQDDLHSHWVVKTFGGKKLEWDAVVIAERENEMFSWHSLPGADIDNGGSVWLTPVAGGTGTEVRLELKYVPPGGKTVAFVSKLFRKDADTEISEDLKRLKTLLETGQLPEAENDDMRQWPANHRIHPESRRCRGWLCAREPVGNDRVRGDRLFRIGLPDRPTHRCPQIRPTFKVSLTLPAVLWPLFRNNAGLPGRRWNVPKFHTVFLCIRRKKG